MKEEYLEFLCCPECRGELSMQPVKADHRGTETGAVRCDPCDRDYPIRNYVPRFVDDQTYARSFGPQWKTFAKSQLDNASYHESGIRFESEIGWDKQHLSDKSVVEFGSGAGRFVDVVSKLNPRLVVGMDITDAVDASQENLGDRANVFFIQADIFKHPLKKGWFDNAYSIGVLHHTPDPQRAFNRMVDVVKDYGSVAVSLYDISLYRRPNRNSLKVATMELLWSLNLWRCEFFRQITTHVPDSVMILYCKTVIPVLHLLNKIPVIGLVRYLVPSTCYKHLPMICSMVDTMDTYSTKIVHQYRSKDVFQWFRQLGLQDILVMNSRAGWVSVNANVGDEKIRESMCRHLRQPKSPGQAGFVE